MKIEKDHITEYLVLSALLGVFFTLIVVYRYNRSSLILLSFLGSAFYVIWGIIHHALQERLNKLIALEYVLMGLLVFLLLFTVLSF